MAAGGEIAASTPTPCSQMGNGIDAGTPPGANNSAAVGYAYYTVNSAAPANVTSSFSPMVDSRYASGFYWGNPSSAFHYGGPGFHAC
jgi:hypothetical protein